MKSTFFLNLIKTEKTPFHRSLWGVVVWSNHN